MNIKEVSTKLDIPADTLRYWERVGVIPPVTRATSGYRDYQPEDLNACNFAKCMREAGVSIETLIEYIDLLQQGDDTTETRKALLQEQLKTIAAKRDAVQATYDKLQQKIAHYGTHTVTPFAYKEEK
ncbi:MerR family transcriptional regulator [Lacticaseibacillus porcinae]|uniref:MerR family transcriptional regulator n=1 Tax=Lacticaseibacillus porcinae TaxID=1123687 RepID=UPI000F7A1AD4|nr:MerR family transcriptional regulator [Lacticaseibacillus porcinae]